MPSMSIITRGLPIIAGLCASIWLGSTLASATPKHLSRPSAAQTSAFSVLRQPPTTRVPAALAVGAAQQDIAASYAPNSKLTRVEYPRGDRSDAWYVMPGVSSICFFAERESQAACGTLAEVEAHGLLVWQVPHGASKATAVFGLVPDDVTSAVADAASGKRVARVDGNVLRVSGRGITSLVLRTRTGARQVRLVG